MSFGFTRGDHTKRSGGMARRIANAARRVVVTLSTGGLWQVAGFDRGDGEDGEPPFQAPVFQGIGFASRPSGDTEAEAILVRLGEEAYAVVGLRDEDIRISLEQGETAIFNKAGAVVKLTKDGDIELTPAAGRQVKAGGAAVDGVIKGTARNTAEQTFLTALNTFAQATLAAAPAKSAFATAVTAFSTAATAAISQTTLTE